MRVIQDMDISGFIEPKMEVAEFVKETIESHCYENGQVEQAAQIAKETLKLVSRLFQWLADNDKITAVELATIVKGYHREDAKFVE